MKINPFEEHPSSIRPQRSDLATLVYTASVLDAIDKAIVMNFELRAEDAASYVAVDNTLKQLKHFVEDLAHE